MNILAEMGMHFEGQTSGMGTPLSGAGRKPGALQLPWPGACGLPAAPRGSPQGTFGHVPPTPLEQRSCVCWACGCWVFGVLTIDFPTCGSCHLTILEGVSRKAQVASPGQLLIPSPSYFVTGSGPRL